MAIMDMKWQIGGIKMLETIKPIPSKAIEATSFDRGKSLSIEKKEVAPKVSENSENTDVKVRKIAQAMDNYVQSIKRDLKIQVHQNTGKLMVTVISENDGKIIREIPPEELLDLGAKVEEMMGVLLNENA
jgi:flagellar protein FlaG